MSTDLTTSGYTQEQIDLVKRTVARGASNDELSLFLHIAKRTGLDPFARQIYAIKRRENVDGQWVERMSTQTGIDGFRVVADRTGCYSPGREPTFCYDNDGRLLSATAYVKKRTPDGTWHEIAATAHWHEYVALKRDGTPTRMWAEKPHVMLSKCSEAVALRKAFPMDLSGVYTSDEMRHGAEDAEFEEKPAAPQPQERQALPAPAPEKPAEPAAPAPARKPEKKQPRNGKELHDVLDGFDQQLAAERRIARGDLVAHVTAAIAQAGHPADLKKLDDQRAILAARDVAAAYAREHRGPLPADAAPAGAAPAFKGGKVVMKGQPVNEEQVRILEELCIDKDVPHDDVANAYRRKDGKPCERLDELSVEQWLDATEKLKNWQAIPAGAPS
jgi:phage recombination protein Bet